MITMFSYEINENDVYVIQSVRELRKTDQHLMNGDVRFPVYVDSAGGLWFGYVDQGLRAFDYLDTNERLFRKLPPNVSVDLFGKRMCASGTGLYEDWFRTTTQIGTIGFIGGLSIVAMLCLLGLFAMLF
jgi:hypothetical protein